MGIPSAQSRSNSKTTSGAAGARAVVESLYASLARGDAAAATALLAADVDWWFHGPRRCQQHMRRLLTGGELSARTAAAAFRFAPARVAEVGEGWVLAEGWASAAAGAGEEDYWVHAWRVRGGVISGFREYFNTSVTVRELGLRAGPAAKKEEDAVWAVWESQSPWPKAQRCMPGLVLAI